VGKLDLLLPERLFVDTPSLSTYDAPDRTGGSFMRKCVLLACLAVSATVVVAQDQPTITVLDFQINNIAEGDMRSIISLLSSALFQTGQYKVIDVSQRDTILKELEFSQSDCTDESCQLEIGKMLSAEMIVVGNIGKVGARYLLSTKILETETGNTLHAADGIYKDLESLIDDIYSFAARLAGDEEEAVAEKPAEEKPAPEPEPEPAEAKPSEEKPEEEEPAEETKQPEAETTAEAPPAEAVGEAEPEPASEGRARRGAAVGTLVGGIVGLTGGAAAVIWAQTMRSGSGAIADAYNDYEQAEYVFEERNPGTSFLSLSEEARLAFFDELYNRYEGLLARYKYLMIGGIAAGGVGVVLVGTSVVLFLLPDRADSTRAAADISVMPTVGAGGLGLRVRY
jgi:hypothetical protein